MEKIIYKDVVKRAKQLLIRGYKEFDTYNVVLPYIRTEYFEKFIKNNLIFFLLNHDEIKDLLLQNGYTVYIASNIAKMEAEVAITVMAPVIKQYLVERNIYKQYIKNTTKYLKYRGVIGKLNDEITIEFILEYLYERRETMASLIMTSFCWAETNEGSHFWRNMYYDFSDYLRNFMNIGKD